MESGRAKGETNSGTRGSGSGLTHGPFDTSEIGSACAPIGNLAHRLMTSEVCSSIILVISGAVSVVTTVPGAVPLEQCPCSLIVLVTSGAVTVVPTVPGAVPLKQCPCSLIVLITSGAVTVVPTVPGAVPLEISPSFSEIVGKNSDVDLIADYII